ncbi:SpdB [Streptomyces sp. XY511]|nr:SpdB [Streptomyces sp. XY511]
MRSSERALAFGTWLIVSGAMLYSILTVTPLMAAHTPDAWDWTAPILPLVVDAAVLIVVRLDSVLARMGGHGGPWPVALRWMTGAMTLLLNIGASALVGDMVGVAVHAVAPLLLIVTAEAGLAYRRALTAAVLAAEERKQAQRDAAARAAVEREQDRLRAERERRDHEAAQAREQREHEAKLARDADERRARILREEADRAEAARRAEEEAREARERREHEREQAAKAREQAARQAAAQRAAEERRRAEEERQAAVERAERERAELLSAGPALEKLEEVRARQVVQAAYAAGLTQRQAIELTGWSAGWIAARYQELRDLTAPVPRPVLEGASQ